MLDCMANLPNIAPMIVCDQVVYIALSPIDNVTQMFTHALIIMSGLTCQRKG